MAFVKHKAHGKSVYEQVDLLEKWIKENYKGVQLPSTFTSDIATGGKKVKLKVMNSSGKLENDKASVYAFHNAEAFNETGMVATITSFSSAHEPKRTINLFDICRELGEDYYSKADGTNESKLTPEQIAERQRAQAAREKKVEEDRIRVLKEIEQKQFVAKIFAQIECHNAIDDRFLQKQAEKSGRTYETLSNHNYLQEKGLGPEGLKMVNTFPLKAEFVAKYFEENIALKNNGTKLSYFTPNLTDIQNDPKFQNDRERAKLVDEIMEFQTEKVSKYYRNNSNQPIILPMKNIEGEIVAFQTITKVRRNEAGEKQANKFYMADAQRTGTFMTLGDLDFKNPEKVKNIIVCEGWATGRSVAKAVDNRVPVLPALDVGGIRSVVPLLLEKFPNASITVAMDNDHSKHLQTEVPKRINAGILKGGIELLDALPENHVNRVRLITPRWEHNNPKHLKESDFNDLDMMLKDDAKFKAMFRDEFRLANDRAKANVNEQAFWSAFYLGQQMAYRMGRDDMPEFLPANFKKLENHKELINAYLPLVNQQVEPVVAAPVSNIPAPAAPNTSVVTTPVHPQESQAPQNTAASNASVQAVEAAKTPSIMDLLNGLKNKTHEELSKNQYFDVGSVSGNRKQAGIGAVEVDTPEVPAAQPDAIILQDSRTFTNGLLRYQQKLAVDQQIQIQQSRGIPVETDSFTDAVQMRINNSPTTQLVMGVVNPNTRDVVMDKLKQHAENNPDNPNIQSVHSIMNDVVLFGYDKELQATKIQANVLNKSLCNLDNKDEVIKAVTSAVGEMIELGLNRVANESFMNELEANMMALDNTQNWGQIIEQAQFVNNALTQGEKVTPEFSQTVNSSLSLP